MSGVAQAFGEGFARGLGGWAAAAVVVLLALHVYRRWFCR